MIPLSDANPTRRIPILTYVLIAINVLVFLWEMTLGERVLQNAFLDLSIVPAKFSANPASLEAMLDLFRSMFFHGGFEHIAGNMLYLWLFGDNVEDRLGKLGFLFLYFASGIAAALAQIMIDPNSEIPLVGASGAIAGVLGSYLILFPGIKVRGLMPMGRMSTMSELPAWIVLGFWFVLQLVSGIGSLGANAQYGGGVAFFAHIGGFVMGMILTVLLMQIVPQPPAEERKQIAYQRVGSVR